MSRMTAGQKQIKEELVEQLRLRGIDTSYYLNLVDNYIDFMKLEKKLKDNIKEKGVMISIVTSNGQKSQKKNESVSLLINTQKQKMDILTRLGIDPDSIISEEDLDEL